MTDTTTTPVSTPKTPEKSILHPAAWEFYMQHKLSNFLPLIFLWHVHNILGTGSISFELFRMLIHEDGPQVDCGPSGFRQPWRFVVLSPAFLTELRRYGTLTAMEKDDALLKHTFGCFSVKKGKSNFLPGTPFYRTVPTGYTPEVIDGERVYDPALEAKMVAINAKSVIGQYITARGGVEWPMTRAVAGARAEKQRAQANRLDQHKGAPLRQSVVPSEWSPGHRRTDHQSANALKRGTSLNADAVRDLELAYAK